MAPKRRAWSLLTVTENRQYAGNMGYRDDPMRSYQYDSDVANSRQLREGDLVVLRDRERVIGASIVDSIVTAPSLKERLRCPVCSTTGIKRRKNSLPVWRCNQSHEFDEPIRERAAITEYRADYGTSFRTPQKYISAKSLKAAALRPSDQISIEEIDPTLFRESTKGDFPGLTELISDSNGLPSIFPTDAEDGGDGSSYEPGQSDDRDRTLRSILARRGQKKFRDDLRRRYGDHCMISGCKLLDIVEAAHIRPHRGINDNHPENGLLLRADLHTLFDLNRIGIEPMGLSIAVSDEAAHAGYDIFVGVKLRTVGQKRPSQAALMERWSEFQKQTR